MDQLFELFLCRHHKTKTPRENGEFNPYHLQNFTDEKARDIQILRMYDGSRPIISDMEKIATEFGFNLILDKELSAIEKICMQYPYTVDLCRHCQAMTGSMDKALSFQGITDSDAIASIKAAVNFHIQDNKPLPSLAKEIADANHILKDSFPSVELYLVDIKRDDMLSYYFFSTAPQGVDLVNSISCPRWLDWDYRGLWEITEPQRVGVGLNRSEHSGVIAMEGFNFSIREYFANDIENAIKTRIKWIDSMDWIKKTKETHFRSRRSPGNDNSMGIK